MSDVIYYPDERFDRIDEKDSRILYHITVKNSLKYRFDR